MSMHLPESLCFLFHLKPNLVTTSSILLVLHGLDHSRKALDAFDQRILIFPLWVCELAMTSVDD